MPASIVGGKPLSSRAMRRSRFRWRDEIEKVESHRYLSRVGLEILVYVAWLTACARRDRPDRAPLVQCKQETIGDAIGCGREAVNRALSDELVPFGLIDVTQRGRHPVSGFFQTCLYSVTKLARMMFGGLAFQPGRRDLYENRVRYKSHVIVDVPPFRSLIAHSLGSSPPETA
ncbi:MAG TPA: hypothetical protein VED01_07750 [Burkholderiales bacterium]|nr:hypothetical protein [Burkholderiales bacterium]